MTLLEQLRAALVGRYTIEREAGRGGMATVFLAEDVKHKRPVAIKVLNPDIGRLVGPDRFLREIEIAARLTHPHILPVFDSGSADGLLYYVMPFVQGESLRQRLERENPLPVADAVRIAREVADALDYAHRRGFVHRDIKPENVLLEEGHAFVADFGVARALAAGTGGGPKLTEVGIAIGTPYYMSPEQAAGEEGVDGRADLYALGCVLFEMLAGRPVFEGNTAQVVARQHLFDTPRRLRSLRADVPQGLETVVERALAKTPAERWTSGAEIASALETGEVPAFGTARPRRRPLVIAGAIVAVAAGVLLVRGLRGDRAIDPDLVAVAPFDVLVSDLHLWREGLVDVLARNLDGAGPLRTVAPTVAVRRWNGRADQPSARTLGRRTGAGLALYGTLEGVGRDSVRLSATLLDVSANQPLGEFQVRDASDRMDRIADSLSLALLRELGRTRPIGAVRLASFGSRSLPALRAFLRAEQFYRRTDWDSAIAYYDRALALDSTFTLALHRTGVALGWQRAGGDARSRALHLKAGALNHGLSPHDSLLVTGDSIAAVLYTQPFDSLRYPRIRRLLATLEEGTRRYPDDPEVWYALGDARFHFGTAPGIGGTNVQALAAFDRAIALDSAFGPSYIHPVDLALNLHGPEAAQRYIRPYLALDPKDVNARGIRIVSQVIDANHSADARRMLDTVSSDALLHALAGGLGRWPDTSETVLSALGQRLERAKGADSARLGGAGLTQFHLGMQVYRGHVRAVDLQSLLPQQQGGILFYRALFGIVSADSADRAFAAWYQARSPGAQSAPPWWATRGDTSSLKSYVGTMEMLTRRPPQPGVRGFFVYQTHVGRAYLALARRDTTEALRLFLSAPDSLCSFCEMMPRAMTVQLLAARGRDAEAAQWLDRETSFDPLAGILALERGRVHERLGNRDRAIAAYQMVTAIWGHGDPEFQALAKEAEEGLRRLTGERSTGS